MGVLKSFDSGGFFRHCASHKMEDLHELVKNVAHTDATILILGESGIGKTTLAKYIHSLSPRSGSGSFVHITCSAIPETLLESELFGHEAGAFTGAGKAKAGLLEIACDGTVFLDEIGDMPLSLQAKMLNVLQEKKLYRVGGTKPIDIDVRLVTATNRNLEVMVEQGTFRQDLYFRLNVIPIVIPALRERREDIPLLIMHYLEEKNKKHNKSKGIDRAAMDVLLNYHWPGNIREVMNVMERLVLMTSGERIQECNLPTGFFTTEHSISISTPTKQAAAPLVFWEPGQLLKSAVRQVEVRIIERAISFYGSVREAAKRLGVDESTITRKKQRQGA